MDDTLLIIDELTPPLDLPAVMARVRVKDTSCYAADLAQLVAEARELARPKAMTLPAYIDDAGEDFVLVNGTRFTSRVLRVNLEGIHRVFPFVATCGVELGQWAQSKGDMLQRYWSEEICHMALDFAVKSLKEQLDRVFSLDGQSLMCPGSLDDWPLTQQSLLFGLMGPVTETIGVVLTESSLMVPVKSLSGIIFGSEKTFYSCQLCPRDKCIGRQAPYDHELLKEKYAGLGLIHT